MSGKSRLTGKSALNLKTEIEYAQGNIVERKKIPRSSGGYYSGGREEKKSLYALFKDQSRLLKAR